MAVLTDVLVVNAGSTSLKLSVVGSDDTSRVVSGFAAAGDVRAVGHRIVHGGERFVAPTVLDAEVEGELRGFVELAPLHNAPALDALTVARRALPDAVHVAVFDTAFHSTLPERSRTYLLPERFRQRGIRRFGFHGLSVQWAAEQVARPRLVVCHLGGGASVTAVAHGRSVETTMGFTPLEGVPMATRAGNVDPGALLHLLGHGVTLHELGHALEHESGLAAIGGYGDVRALEASTSPDAQLVLEIYAYRIAQAVAAMGAALGGIDAIVFTGGVGEHSARVRAAVCEHLSFVGVRIDSDANARGETSLAAEGSAVDVVVVAAREDVVAARAVRTTLGIRA